jgi:NAD(P)-dependent dehydrogenase (short-subunit alcohol dehydrogenase family)
MPSFAGRVVVVTGASSGIGKALCVELAGERPRLVLAARDEARLEEVAGLCAGRGAETLVAPTDVTSEEACRRLVARTVERFGGLDVLVNNAGIGLIARVDELADLSAYERLMRVNYLGCVYPTVHALPELKRSKGRIAVVSSLTGLTGVPTRAGYSATKHAVFGFFDSLRIELKGTGVTVTMIAPDYVVTEIHRRAIGPDGRPLGRTPLDESRIMTAEDCARIILRGLAQRRRLVIPSWRGRVGRYVRLIAPGLIDAVAERAVRRGR